MRAIAILLGVTSAVVVGLVVLLRTESFAGEERSAQVVRVDLAKEA